MYHGDSKSGAEWGLGYRPHVGLRIISFNRASITKVSLYITLTVTEGAALLVTIHNCNNKSQMYKQTRKYNNINEAPVYFKR